MPTFTGPRKRQARLAFTPIPSSSPAAKDYNPQIQERAAAVRYDDNAMNPSKRRKTQANHDTANENVAMIPTPSTSLPQGTADGAEDSDEEPVRSTQPRSAVAKSTSMRNRPRQQRIDFENAVPTSSRQSVNMQSPITAGPSGSCGNVRAGPGSASSDESDVLPSPSKVARKSKSRSKANNKKRKLNDDGFMGPSGSRVTRSSRKQVLNDDPDDDPDDEVAVREAPKPQVSIISDDDEAEDEEDQMPTTLGTQRRKKEKQSSFISSSPPGAMDSDDDLHIIDNPRKARLGNHRIEVSGNKDEDEDEDIAPVTPARRRLVNQRKFTQQEQEDLAEDLGFLEPSSDVDEERRPRNTQSSQKSARMKALDRLKQKRSSQRGLPEIVEDDDEDEEADEGADDDDGSVVPERQQTYVPASSRSMFQADAEDEDFLVEEGEDDTLGVPEALPIEFSRYASMKTKELFGYAVEWMVQKKVNPAFAGDDARDQLYKLAFKKLNDEVAGLVGSKFQSSAWTPDFTVAIRSRPVIAYSRLDRGAMDNMFRDKCDACNRTGHPATYEVQFQKKPYDRDTLDEVNQNEDDSDDDDGESSSSGDDSDDGDRPDWNADGVRVPPASRIWYLGNFCMSNAQTAHALQHWRLHLYEWVVDWIDKNGYSTPEKLKKRDRMSTNKRKKHAYKIKDRMEAEGVIKTLWKEFRSTIDEAVNAKQGRYDGDSP